MNYKQNIIRISSTIIDALNQLNNLNQKILFVVNHKKKLIGTITDSDIRNFYLKKNNYDGNIKKIINKNFYYIKKKNPKKNLNNTYRFIPILDKEKKIIDVIDNKKNKFYNNMVIIIAGGKGKRLGQITKNKPKPMLTYNRKPHLHELIENLISQGFKKFTICLNHKYSYFIDYFNQKNIDAKIDFLVENHPLGTAGPLSNVKLKNNLPAIVMNADIHTSLSFNTFVDFHNEKKSDFTICVKENIYTSKYGEILISKNKIKEIKEKPKKRYFFNSGIYIISRKCIALLKKNEKKQMNDFISQNIKLKMKVIPFFLWEKWIDFGSKRDLNKLKKYIASKI